MLRFLYLFHDLHDVRGEGNQILSLLAFGLNVVFQLHLPMLPQ